MMSSEPQLGHRRKGGMLDIGDEDGGHPPFYLSFKKRHYPILLSYFQDVSTIDNLKAYTKI